MRFEPSKEYIEAVLLLRSTAQFAHIVRELQQYRNELLEAVMSAGPEHVERLRHRAGAVHDIVSSVEQVEQLRQQYDTHGQAETGTQSIRAG